MLAEHDERTLKWSAASDLLSPAEVSLKINSSFVVGMFSHCSQTRVRWSSGRSQRSSYIVTERVCLITNIFVRYHLVFEWKRSWSSRVWSYTNSFNTYFDRLDYICSAKANHHSSRLFFPSSTRSWHMSCNQPIVSRTCITREQVLRSLTELSFVDNCSRDVKAKNGPLRRLRGVDENEALHCSLKRSQVKISLLHPQLRLKQHLFRLTTVTGTGEKSLSCPII